MANAKNQVAMAKDQMTMDFFFVMVIWPLFVANYMAIGICAWPLVTMKGHIIDHYHIQIYIPYNPLIIGVVFFLFLYYEFLFT